MVNLLVIASGFMASAQEHSYIGGELDLFALATNWKGYIKKEVSGYTTGDVLEVGAGIGATTASTARWHGASLGMPRTGRALSTALKGSTHFVRGPVGNPCGCRIPSNIF